MEKYDFVKQVSWLQGSPNFKAIRYRDLWTKQVGFSELDPQQAKLRPRPEKIENSFGIWRNAHIPSKGQVTVNGSQGRRIRDLF